MIFQSFFSEKFQFPPTFLGEKFPLIIPRKFFSKNRPLVVTTYPPVQADVVVDHEADVVGKVLGSI
jgi:hypothetical protein